MLSSSTNPLVKEIEWFRDNRENVSSCRDDTHRFLLACFALFPNGSIEVRVIVAPHHIGQILKNLVPYQGNSEFLGYSNYQNKGHVKVDAHPLDQRLTAVQFVCCLRLYGAVVVALDSLNTLEKEVRQCFLQFGHHKNTAACFGHHGRRHEGLHDLYAFIVGKG